MSANRDVVYTLRINSNVSAMLNQTEKDALRLDSTMWQLQKTLSAFGVGLGANFLIDAAKQWTQGAADFETAMLRIKNASEGIGDAFKNELFINKEVDQFKTKLQETIDSYGSFLFKIKNAGLTGEQKNKLFDDVLTVSKVSGIPMSEMESTIRNTSIMLGEGVLEARHLRGLSYTHPQIVPFLADALGIKSGEKDQFDALLKIKSESEIANTTKEQELSRLISSGKMTKLAIPANVILEAFNKYAESVKDKLPETLSTVQSELNETSNVWERFKNNLVLENKGELVDFLHELTGGVHWLVDHQSEIINVASSIGSVIKMYIEWKVAMLAVQGVGTFMSAMRGETTLFASEQVRLNSALSLYSAKQTQVATDNLKVAETENLVSTAVTSQTASLEKETIAIEEQHIALNQLALSLEEVSVQMELFTDAQMMGARMFESKMIPAFHGWNMYSYGSGAFQNKSVMSNVAASETQIINNELRQAHLFTAAELEMQAAMTSTGDALAIQNEQLAIRNGLLAESASLADANALAAISTLETMKGNKRIINPYSGMFSSSSVSSGLVSVFIAGMAAELINGFLPSGAFSGNKMEVKDWLYGVAQATNPWYWMDDKGKDGRDGGHGFGKIHDIAKENAAIETLQSEISKRYPAKFDVATGKITNPYLQANGTNLYQILRAVQEATGVDLMDLAGLKTDMNGKMDTSERNVWKLLNAKNMKLPFIDADDSSFPFPYASREEAAKAKAANYNIGDSQAGKDTNKIRGNSSNYFTVHVEEMNGVKEFKVTSENGDLTTSRVAEIAGDTILKMLADAVNDSQMIKQH